MYVDVIFFEEGYWILAILFAVYLFGAFTLGKSKDKDDFIACVMWIFVICSIVCSIPLFLGLYTCAKNADREYTMVVDVYLNPQKPTRKVFKSWQHEIRVEYDVTFYHPKPALRHNGSNVVKITTPADLLYKVNAPVEIVSYTYKVKKHQMTDREKELIERVMQGLSLIHI